MLNNDEMQYITFKLEKDYGIELTRIKEIIPNREFTRAPETPEFILGILNLKDTTIPVIDLGKLFQLPGKEMDEYAAIILMEVLGRLVGMRVDEVSDVITVRKDHISTPQHLTHRIVSKFIKGMVEKEKKMIMLLDADKLFSADEIEAIDGI